MPSLMELLIAIAIGYLVLLNIQQLALSCIDRLVSQGATTQCVSIPAE